LNPKLWKRLREVSLSLRRRSAVTHREIYEVLASEAVFRGEPLPAYLPKPSKECLEDWLGLFDIQSPADAGDVGRYYLLSQARALVAKFRYDIPGLDALAEERAWNKFLTAEQSCSTINDAFKAGTISLSSDELHRMRGFISYVLGDCPSYEELSSELAFGPGAAHGIHGQATSSYRKLLAQKWSVSSASRDYARVFAHTHPQFLEVLVDPEEYSRDEGAFYRAFNQRVDIVDHNTVLFVPKTTLTRRSIATEPLLNNWLQTAVDVTMRKRLKRVGNDLSDQSRNQRMAWEGSFDLEDGFCTIDLSSASDSISTELVRALLPEDWFYLLDRLRSRSYSYKSTKYSYAKFCSMGNGFCFPLQTLLFLAIVNTCESGCPSVDYRVYGDDIIVRKSQFASVVDLLSRCGFTTNSKKTFSKGPFRESCGGEFWLGVDVCPAEVSTLGSLPDIFIFHNLLRRSFMTQTYMKSVQDYLHDLVPQDVRFVVPVGMEASWLPGSNPKVRHGGPPSLPETPMGGFALETHDERFLTSPHVRRDTRAAKAVQGWEFKELVVKPQHLVEGYGRDPRQIDAAILYAALSGSSPDGYNNLRRETKTDVRRRAHG
jgi:hypothetical protein